MNLEEHFTQDDLDYIRGLDTQRKFPWNRFLLASAPAILMLALGVFFLREMYLLGYNIDPDDPLMIVEIHLLSDDFPPLQKMFSGQILNILINFKYGTTCLCLGLLLLMPALLVSMPLLGKRRIIECWRLLSQQSLGSPRRIEDIFSEKDISRFRNGSDMYRMSRIVMIVLIVLCLLMAAHSVYSTVGLARSADITFHEAILFPFEKLANDVDYPGIRFKLITMLERGATSFFVSVYTISLFSLARRSRSNVLTVKTYRMLDGFFEEDDSIG